jgi:ABC-type branched-subunit amino acid transport system permease subunit
VPERLGLDVDVAQVTSGLYGAIIVLVVLLRPGGLVRVPSGSWR